MSLKWPMAALAVMVAFLAAGVAGAAAAQLLRIWYLPVAGFCAASAVVAVAYLAAPARKLPFALCSFAVGAFVAWLVLVPAWFPESCGAKAYQPTLMPFLATCAGGLASLAAAWALRRRAGHTAS